MTSLVDTLTSIQSFLVLTVYPIWLIFGIIGCLLNLIVFSRPQLRKISCSLCNFFAASITNIITLIFGIGTTLYIFKNPYIQSQSILFCKIRSYIFQVCLMLSRWFVAFACIDRATLTSQKMNLRNFAKGKNAYRVIICIIIFWSIICSHRLIFYQIKGKFCGIVNDVPAALYHSLYVIIGGGILPTTIMIVCAYLIRWNLARKTELRGQILKNDRLQSRIDHQVHKVLFVQIGFYIIFTMPQLCNLVFNAISARIPNRSDNYLIIEAFVAFIAELILYLFPVTSFYLYTLTSRKFRKELIDFFHFEICRNYYLIPMENASTRNRIEMME